MKRVFLIIVDGLGIGAQEDAFLYGDSGANTLLSALRASDGILENFSKLGLGNLLQRTLEDEPEKATSNERFINALPQVHQPLASYGKMREVSAGKDSTTGHWELAGLHLEQPFPTYPTGFPDALIQSFCNVCALEGILCNRPYSGTDVIRDFGEEHQQTGKPIVYTSADSVFQIAAHTETVPLETLYHWCHLTREQVCTGSHEVGRVIARPFEGEPGNYRRIPEARKDFSSIPPAPNLLTELQQNRIATYAIGKVSDLFAGKGFDASTKTESNAEGLQRIYSSICETPSGKNGVFVFANLIDTDQLFGHRQDPSGYFHCLMEIDNVLPDLLHSLKREDLLIITGDHGNDPDDESTDHTREFVPLLVIHGDTRSYAARYVGTRSTFADVSATVLDWFSVDNKLPGTSFLQYS